MEEVGGYHARTTKTGQQLEGVATRESRMEKRSIIVWRENTWNVAILIVCVLVVARR